MSQELQQLLEIEKIKQLKYRYFRLLDMKRFDELVTLCADNISTAYDNGRHSVEGKDALLSFLNETMYTPNSMTSHQGHHPEITLIDDHNATGIWHFEDTVVRPDYKVVVTGSGIYWDEYVKEDGEWKLARTAYERLFVRTEKLDEEKLLELRGLWTPEEITRSNERPKTARESGMFPHRTEMTP
jgi:hypothetical protein